MFAAERIRIIKGLLIDKKHINVSDLSDILKVSEVTIRRDLEKLEKESFLTRTHGGAILSDSSDEDTESVSEDEDLYFQERNQIAGIAIHMVEDNDVIILSSGLTNQCIASKLVNKKNLTVLTNDLHIASELSNISHIKVIMPGGDLDSNSMTLSGKLAEENIRKFYVSKAFIEVDGASFERGFTVQSMETASLFQEMVKISKQCIIVCPHQVFGNIAFAQVAPLLTCHKLVTTPQIPDKFKDYFFNNNINLYTAFNAYGIGGNNL